MKSQLYGKKGIFQRLFLFWSSIFWVTPLSCNGFDENNKVFEKPLLFLVVVGLILFVYKYLDIKKKKKR